MRQYGMAANIMTGQHKGSSVSPWRQRGILVAILVCLGALYLGVQPVRHRLAAETELARKQLAALQASSGPAMPSGMPLHAEAARDMLPYLRAEAGGFPQNHHTRRQLALSCFVAGLLDEAAEHAKALIKLLPKDPDALVLLGDIRRAGGRFDEAELAYRRALGLAPNHVQALSGLGQLYVAVGWPAEAEALLKPALNKTPNELLLTMGLGLAYLQQNRFQEAERHLLSVRRLAPDKPALWSGLLRLYNNTRRHRETVTLAEEALAKSSGGEKAMILYEKGKALYQLNDIPKATESLRDALAIRPDNPYARYYLGLCLQRDNRLAEVAQELERVLQLDPDYQQARLVLGRLYIRLNRVPEGKKLLAEHRRREKRYHEHSRAAERIANEPRNAEAHWQMARIYEQDKKIPLLIMELRKTLELNPRHKEAKRLLKTTLHVKGRGT